MAEIAQFIDDAAVAGVAAEMKQALARGRGPGPRLRLLFGPDGPDPAFRLRSFLLRPAPGCMRRSFS